MLIDMTPPPKPKSVLFLRNPNIPGVLSYVHRVKIVCIVAASDGVWDNWLYADVSGFFLDPERASEVINTNSAEGVTETFMRENARRANDNFGAQVCFYSA